MSDTCKILRIDCISTMSYRKFLPSKIHLCWSCVWNMKLNVKYILKSHNIYICQHSNWKTKCKLCLLRKLLHFIVLALIISIRRNFYPSWILFVDCNMPFHTMTRLSCLWSVNGQIVLNLWQCMRNTILKAQSTSVKRVRNELWF